MASSGSGSGSASLCISLEGVIGAGKSTLLETLKKWFTDQGYVVWVVREPVDKWVKSGLLQKFYEDGKRWAYTFQTAAFLDRMFECKKVVSEIADYKSTEPQKHVILMERSPQSDRMFLNVAYNNGLVNDMELEIYNSWWTFWHQLMPFDITYYLYLQTDTETAMSRLRRRNRDGEAGIEDHYQQQLQNEHNLLFLNHPKTIVIDGSADFTRELPQEVARHLSLVIACDRL